MNPALPVIDLGGGLGPESPRAPEIAAALDEAFRRTGFCYESEITCLPTCTGPDNPPRHEPVRYADYVLERLDRNYAYRQRST